MTSVNVTKAATVQNAVFWEIVFHHVLCGASRETQLGWTSVWGHEGPRYATPLHPGNTRAAWTSAVGLSVCVCVVLWVSVVVWLPGAKENRGIRCPKCVVVDAVVQQH